MGTRLAFIEAGRADWERKVAAQEAREAEIRRRRDEERRAPLGGQEVIR